MALPKLGYYLVSKGLISDDDLVKALNIQRRRQYIPMGEIALHGKMLTSTDILNILDYQSKTKDKFGKIAVGLGILNQGQVNTLLEKQQAIRGQLGSILVEIGAIDDTTLDRALQDYSSAKKQFINKARSNQAVSRLEVLRAEKAPEIEVKAVLPSAIIEKTICCPLCGRESPQWYLSKSSFSVVRKDFDLKPLEYSWIDSENAKLNPLFFNVWSCPSCSYSAGRLNYEEVNRDVAMSKSAFLKRLKLAVGSPVSKRVIELLSPTISDYRSLSFATTIKQYLLAIYFLSNIKEVAQKDSLQLAKYSLNLGWLYREVTGSKTGLIEIRNIKSAVHKAREFWPEIPLSEKSALLLCKQHYETAFYESQIPEQNEVEHILLQQLGRVNLRLRNDKGSHENFTKGIKLAQDLQLSYEMKLNRCKEEQKQRMSASLSPKINGLSNYVHETQILLKSLNHVSSG